MGKYLLSHKFLFTAIIIETLFILFIALSSLGKTTNIELKADDFEIYDSKAEIGEYEPVESHVLDENTLLIYDNKETQDIEKSIYISETNEDEAFGRWIIGSDYLTLRPGMYELEVKYYSLWYNEYGGRSDEASGAVQIISESSSSDILYNELELSDNLTVNRQRLWVRSLKSIDDVQIKVSYYGLGELRIDSIAVKELPLWRLLKLILWIVAFGIIDLLYVLLFADSKVRNKEAIALITFATFYSCLPIYSNFIFEGDDIGYHIARIWAIAENIREGQLSFPIQLEMLNGYGYASPIFYGQLFLYIPAFIYLMGAPMQVCFQIYIGLINVATALICYLCMDGIIKDKKIAAVGTVLYTLSAYRLVNILLRAAVGEYTAMVFFPLIVYGFIKIYSKPADKISWKECLAIIVGLTGVIESHILTCEMVAIFIIALCLICLKKTFELRRFVALLCTAIATVMLNAAFLIPFLDSMGMQIKINLMGVDQIQNGGGYLLQILGIFMNGYGGNKTGMQGEMPLTLGFSLVLGIGILAWCNMNKFKWNENGNTTLRVGTICSAFAVCCIILSLRIFPWDSIENISPTIAKILCTVQFPWRYLSIATIFTLTATVIGLKVAKNHMQNQSLILVEAVLVLFALLQAADFYYEFANSATEGQIYGGADVVQDIGMGEYKIGNDETETIDDEMYWKSIKTDLDSIEIADYTVNSGIVTFTCRNISNGEEFVQIPILNYDNYHAYTEDGTELVIENGENNRVGIWIPASYNGTIRVQYVIPQLWKVANVITALTFMGIVITCATFRVRRRNKVEENSGKWYMIAFNSSMK
jgi:hypothetical protein